MRVGFVFVVLLIASHFALAADKPPQPEPAQAERVIVVTDQKAGAVRIVIDGKEVAWFDATGFYVRGDVAYKGTITDGLPRKGDTPGAR